MPVDDHQLLTSPIERRALSRLFIIGGPVGLAVSIMLSLWVSHQHVTHAVIVQAEPQWVVGETLALRVQVVPEAPQPLGDAAVELAVEQGGERHPLDPPSSVAPGGMAHGRFVVPSLTPGPAVLHVHVEAAPFDPRDERIPIEVVTQRSVIEGRHLMSSSMSQYADDSDPQPDALKIDLRPRGRVLAGFDNELWLRVTDAKGRPWSGPVGLRLVDGEMADRRGELDAPPLLWEGRTDAAGLASIHGALSSEVLRVLVQIRSDDDPPKVLHERRIRLVSFAGAVDLVVEPAYVQPGQPVEVLAAGLSAKRPVFVDVYGPDGAWIDTFDPPVQGREPARPWSPTVPGSALVQLEAYHFTNAPGESTAVARLLIDPHDGSDPASLAPLLSQQRRTLSLPRNDRTWDEARERGYLDALAARPLSAAALGSARRWLLGTLPIEVHGPPVLLQTRDRDHAALLAYKQAWALGMRIFLLAGGGGFLLAMTVLMVRSHTRDAEATLRELLRNNEGSDRDLVEQQVQQARRAALLRGLLMVVMMAGGLACAVLLLESFVWEF